MSIGYKKAADGFIVKLEILGENNENRSGIKPEHVPFAKYRCSEALVLAIYHWKTGEPAIEVVSLSYGIITWENGKIVDYGKVIYKMNEKVCIYNYDPNPDIICGPGIHYFKSEEPAIMYSADSKNPPCKNYTGEQKSFFNNGRLSVACSYINGRKSGEYISWYKTGELHSKGYYN